MSMSVFFLLVILSTFIITPNSIAETQKNFIDIDYANIEGNNISINKINPVLEYYKVNYILKNSHQKLNIIFSSKTKPLVSSIIPSAICEEITKNYFLIFTRLEGYSCNFTNVTKGMEISIIFQNMQTPFGYSLSFFGV